MQDRCDQVAQRFLLVVDSQFYVLSQLLSHCFPATPDRHENRDPTKCVTVYAIAIYLAS